MSPVDELKQKLTSCFPDAEIEMRKADDPNGFQFLNVYAGTLEVAVEWKPNMHFGLSSFCGDSSALDGLFDTPSEWCSTTEATFHRIASLIYDQKSTIHQASKISEIRHDRGMSQEHLSEQLNVKQATYSKLERRGDVKVSSLRKVIEAMGGRLRIQAFFPDTQDVREISFE